MTSKDAPRYLTRSPEETIAFGERIGNALREGDILALTGGLGAGKTVLTKGVFIALGGNPDEVTSPTFVLMTPHEARLTLYHFDAYRLSGPTEILEIGAEEFFYGDGVCVVEWADRVADALPADRLEIRMTVVSESRREIALAPTGPRSAALAAAVASSA